MSGSPKITEYIGKIAPKDKITMISDEAVPAYSRCLITYYLAGDGIRISRSTIVREYADSMVVIALLHCP